MGACIAIQSNQKGQYGHTLTLITEDRAILFGGAFDKTNYTNEVSSLDLTDQDFNFKPLRPKGVPPAPRASHAACKIECNQIVIYGGISSNGDFSKENLFLLSFNEKDKENVKWEIIQVNRKKSGPGQRIGHSIVYISPYICIFGGMSDKMEYLNDVWLLNMKKAPFTWEKLPLNQGPCERMYHSAAVCLEGKYKGMMIIHGGRKTVNKQYDLLNDTWGLRKKENCNWEWCEFQFKASSSPINRFQVSINLAIKKSFIFD